MGWPTCQSEAAWQRGRPATRQTRGNLTGNLPPGLVRRDSGGRLALAVGQVGVMRTLNDNGQQVRQERGRIAASIAPRATARRGRTTPIRAGRDRPTALAHRRAILTPMDAAAVKHLGGICQLQRSILVLQKVLAFACIEANW